MSEVPLYGGRVNSNRKVVLGVNGGTGGGVKLAPGGGAKQVVCDFGARSNFTLCCHTTPAASPHTLLVSEAVTRESKIRWFGRCSRLKSCCIKCSLMQDSRMEHVAWLYTCMH
jgi:hypothetical protein